MASKHSHNDQGSFWVDAAIWIVVLGLLALWGLSIFQWGVLGLYMPAVILVPIIMIVLVLISRG